MKKPLLQFAVLFLLLLPLLGWAQEIRISGRVVDAKTKEPIPFASLSLLKAGAGALTGENGYFQLVRPDGFKQDSLVVMTLGYDRKALFVEPGKTADLRIEMASWPVGWIIGCPVKPGKVPAKNTLTTNDLVIYGLPGTQFAFFIGNDERKHSRKMRSVSFYLGENAFPSEEFRVRIYASEGHDKVPGKDILTENVAFMPQILSGWYTRDLSNFDIVLPETGCFIAIEFVITDNYGLMPYIKNYVPSGQVVRPSFEYKKNSIWSCSQNQGWSLLPQSNSSRRYNAMVKIEVEAVD